MKKLIYNFFTKNNNISFYRYKSNKYRIYL